MNIDEELKSEGQRIRDIVGRIRWLKAHRKKLESLPNISGSGGMCIDFDNLPHAEVVNVVRTLGGKWKKTPGYAFGTVNYHATIDGRMVCCWQGKPPPSCRIIEVEEVIPAKLIPEQRIKVKKLVCKPEFAADIAFAAEKERKLLAEEGAKP